MVSRGKHPGRGSRVEKEEALDRLVLKVTEDLAV
jgi:hypothetical protein